MNSLKTDRPSESIFETIIKNESLKDLIIIGSDFLIGLPVVDSLVKSGKFISVISEKVFERKVLRFLYELKSIPIEKRKEKINEINNSNKLHNSSIGLIILEQLQRIDNEYKPEVLGRLFANFIKEEITLEEYLRLSHIVSNAFYLDLKALKEYSENGIYKNDNYNSLINSEIMFLDYLSIYNKAKQDNETTVDDRFPKLTLIGNLLLKYGL